MAKSSSQSRCKVGAHVSGADDISLAPERAAKIGCECFQFFSRSPQGGKVLPLTPEKVKKFKANMKKYKQSQCYIHTPYFINLGSANNRIYYGSISVLKQELERGSALGAKYIMTHLGSAKDLGSKEAIAKVIRGIGEVLKDYKGKTQFLIEMAAGAGDIIGDTFEEIKKIVNSPKLKKYNIGICFDSAHAFASGYDLRDEKSVQATFEKFNKILGIDKLKLIHANDSKADLASHKDQHQHIGEGKIGLSCFEAIVKLACKQKIDLITETPHDGKEIEDINILKNLRK